MLRNYLKLAFRSLWKQKVYSFINLFGLAIGIAICLLILLFIQSELGYDHFHEKSDRIFRVVADRIYPGRVAAYTQTPASVGAAFQHEFPEIEESTRAFDEGQVKVKAGAQSFVEKGAFAVDSNFFRVFTGRFLEGDGAALQTPGAVVVNETTAKRWFGSAVNAQGKAVEIDRQVFRIMAVCRDWPEKSHLSFNLLVSDRSPEHPIEGSFTGFSAYTYLLLRPGGSPQALEAKFPAAIEKYVAGEIERGFAMTYQRFRASGNGYHYFLQPLTKIHLISNRENELRPNGSIKEVWLFALIAIFILGIACINFINLSTARSMERAKEVGLRKTFGSLRFELMRQFLMESVLMSLFSTLIALGLIVLLLPEFNQLTGKELSARWFAAFLPGLGLLIFALLIGCLAGLYPAFVLSSFKPVLVLKGKFSLLGLQLKEGRFFSDNYSTDSLSLVLNESAAAFLQLAHPIGARMNIIEQEINGPPGSPLKVFTVVGVMRDFHFQSLRQKISPLILRTQPYSDPSAFIGIRIKSMAMAGAISSIEKTWRRLAPDWPFQYTFLDQHLADQYRAELSGGVIALGIALFTVSFQAFRAGAANPIDSLRAE
jgi:putative ABC transport system permease protein